MQRGENKTCEAELGGEEDKMSLVSRWKWNMNLRLRGTVQNKEARQWLAGLNDPCIGEKDLIWTWIKLCHTHTAKLLTGETCSSLLLWVDGRAVRLSDAVPHPFLMPETLREAAAAGGKVRHWHSKVCDRGSKPARGADANQIYSVLVLFSHFCTASSLPHYANPLISRDTKAQLLSGIIFELKRQVSSTMVVFIYQNKHQNLCSAYCCFTKLIPVHW